MKTRDLHYDLPAERIAQAPCEPRDASRLMILERATGHITHRRFYDLPESLRPEDALVLNTTRVLPARFFARRATGGRVEGLFLREVGPGQWRVLFTGVRRLHAGERLTLGEGRWFLTFLRRLERGECEVRLEPAAEAFDVLSAVGTMPLPPYIRREETDGRSATDRTTYQTVYARQPGAVAAPTAGLHFTPELLSRVRGMGVGVCEAVLHVGLGTFAPLVAEDLADHKMHAEWYRLDEDSAAALRARRAAGGRIVAVGTTSVRVLETCAREGELSGGEGWTDIFIYPPHAFRAVDALVTNFHLPGSTLLALVCAFAGREQILEAYHVAIAEGYRFYSYGDAMLIV
jgi:S-adenosylmethionine:tRNA ribosyltransferase-isomerase